jgi:hypothetical protein
MGYKFFIFNARKIKFIIPTILLQPLLTAKRKIVPHNDPYSQPNQRNENPSLIILNSFFIGNENFQVKLQ